MTKADTFTNMSFEIVVTVINLKHGENSSATSKPINFLWIQNKCQNVNTFQLYKQQK